MRTFWREQPRCRLISHLGSVQSPSSVRPVCVQSWATVAHSGDETGSGTDAQPPPGRLLSRALRESDPAIIRETTQHRVSQAWAWTSQWEMGYRAALRRPNTTPIILRKLGAGAGFEPA